MHRVAVILLYDRQEKVLLQHRTDDAPFFPGYWAFFGGGCEEHESPIATVIRETEEELCYRLTDPRFVLEQPFSVQGLRCRLYLFMEHYRGDKNALQLCEGQNWGWFGPGETENLLMAEHDRRALQAARELIAQEQLDYDH